MLSIIVCSRSEELLCSFKKNMHDTVGIDHEIVAYDNKDGEPIARVYNKCAREAKGEFLLFAHEDIEFRTAGWGKLLCDKMEEPDCGVIGFAGSKMRLPVVGPWMQSTESSVCNYCQVNVNVVCREGCRENKDFEEVVTLDGMALCCKKSAWASSPFDEEALQGFHLYDIDFSLGMVAKHLKNYVCTSPKVEIVHFSSGVYTMDWLQQTIKMQRDKWDGLSPIATPDFAPYLNENKGSQYNQAYLSLFYILLIKMHVYNRLLMEALIGKKNMPLYDNLISLGDKFSHDRYVCDLQYQMIKEELKKPRPGLNTRFRMFKYIKNGKGKRRYKLLYKYVWYTSLRKVKTNMFFRR